MNDVRKKSSSDSEKIFLMRIQKRNQLSKRGKKCRREEDQILKSLSLDGVGDRFGDNLCVELWIAPISSE